MQQISVFLASRFGEFSNVRSEIGRLLRENRSLKPHVIDLNDRAVASRPPYEECMRMVEQADIVVLLMGKSYGQLVDGRDKSYTHCEYLHALAHHKRVLAFFIGEGFTGTDADYVLMDSGLQSWAKDVRANHTYETIDAQLEAHFQASEVVRKMYSEVLELLGVRWDEPLNELSPEAQESIRAQEVHNAVRLNTEQRDRQALGLDEMEDDLDDGPEATAAREQRQAAVQALELGEFRLALDLMRRAVERAPLDPENNEDFARWALALANSVERSSQSLDEALAKARLAAKIYDARNRRVGAIRSLTLVAQIYMRRSQYAEALGVLGEVLNLRPNEVTAFLSRARIYIRQGRTERAVNEVMRAAGFSAAALQEVFTDPELRKIAREVRDAQQTMRKDLEESAQGILNTEVRLGELLNRPTPPGSSQNQELSVLLRQARSSVQRQRWQLVQAIAALDQGQRDPAQRTQDAQDAVAAATAQLDRALVQRLSTQARQAQSLSDQDPSVARSLDLELQRAQALEDEAQANLELAQRAVAELQNPAPAITEEQLKHALAAFEKRTLSRSAQLLPFPSLYNNVKDGRLVRMSLNEIKQYSDELERNSRNRSVPQVTIEPLPTWWPSSEPSTRRLYRVTIERGGTPIYRLSGLDAYAADATSA